MDNNFFELIDINDIIKIEEKQNMVDIQVEGDESFCLSNGIISHNSAVTMAISGMSEVGRDYYGAFPLKGKVLNVRGASVAKIKANEEVQNLINILGLEIGKKYETTDDLRYGKCVLMTDADCVEENTKILMHDNTTKKIKDIKKGDIVKSHNGNNKVIGIKESIKNEYVEITIEGNKFKFGLNHKIPVYDIDTDKIEIKLAKNITKKDLIIKNMITDI